MGENAEKVFCVFVKNLKDGKKRIMHSSKLWTIREVSKVLWSRQKLSITSVIDFKEKLSSEKRIQSAPPTEFGVVEGDHMIKHFVIDLAETQDDLTESVKASRPADPKRLSTSDASIPLSYFTNYEERVVASSAKKESSKSCTKGKGLSENKDILDRLHKKRQSEHKTKGKNKELTHLPESNKTSDVKITDRKETSHGSGPRKEPSIKDASTVAELTETIKKLHAKIANMTNQRDQALTELEALRIRFDELKSELATAKAAAVEAAPHALLEEIANNVRKIPETIISSSSRNSCPWANFVYAVDVEEEYKDFNVPNGMIYVGKGQVISRKDVIYIEDEYDSFNKRAECLFNLICKDGIQNYSLKGHKSSKGSTKFIEDNVKTALKRMLRQMDWGTKDFKVTTEVMSKFFRKHPCDVRRRGLKPEEKKIRKKGSKTNTIAKGKKKADESSESESGNEETVKKIAKRKKKADESSESESDNEENVKKIAKRKKKADESSDSENEENVKKIKIKKEETSDSDEDQNDKKKIDKTSDPSEEIVEVTVNHKVDNIESDRVPPFSKETSFENSNVDELDKYLTRTSVDMFGSFDGGKE